jgi:DNA-binding NarL/FixJ family response regulator
MKIINVYLVDDHQLFVEGLVNLLNEKPGFHVHGYACTAAGFLNNLKKDFHSIDVFLVDVNMPDMSGIELTRQITRIKPDAKVLALTMYTDLHYVEKMIQAGAKGYAIKSSNISDLLSAIRLLHEGRNYLDDEVKTMVFENIGNHDVFVEMKSRPAKSALSRREIEILCLVAREFTSQQIADKLFISDLTVETHRKNIMVKTGIKSTVGLVKYAIRQGYSDY